MPDLTFTDFKNEEKHYIDLDEFNSLKSKGYVIPENVILIPVSLSENPDIFEKVLRIKEALPDADINMVTNIAKARLKNNAVIVNTAKLNQYFPSASGIKIISDINSGLPLSDKTAKILIEKGIISSGNVDNYEISDLWNDILNIFGLGETKKTVQAKTILSQPDISQQQVLNPEDSKEFKNTVAGKALKALATPVKSLKALKKKSDTEGKKTIAGKAIKAVLRPVAALKSAKKKKAAKKAAEKQKSSLGIMVIPEKTVSEETKSAIASAQRAAAQQEIEKINHEVLANAKEGDTVTLINSRTGKEKDIKIMPIE